MVEKEFRTYASVYESAPLQDLFNGCDMDVLDYADTPELLTEGGDLVEVTIRRIGKVRAISRMEIELDSAE